MHIYIFRNDIKMNSDDRVRMLLLDYAKDTDMFLTEASLTDVCIQRNPKGKPFFTGGIFNNVHFSVSHSGRYWGCAFEQFPIGFDLEDCKGRQRPFLQYNNMAKRFFCRKEYEYVLKNGKQAFYSLWVRKEAYAKYTGQGIFSSLSVCMVEQNEIVDCFKGLDNHFVFCEEITLLPDIKASYCSNQRPKRINIRHLDRGKGVKIGAGR